MVQIEAEYDYLDEDGLRFQVQRLLPKGFRQRRPDGNGGWIYNMEGVNRILFRYPEVLKAIQASEWIMLVEGEKDANTLAALGKVATTNPGGAGKWLPQYTESLRGAKVTIIADADEPGRKHALQVAAALDRVVAKLLVYEPAAPYKDVTEHLEAGLTLKDLVPFDWRDRLPEPDASPSVSVRLQPLEQFIETTPRANAADLLLGPLLVRGSRFVVAAHTGHGKTTMSLQILAAVLGGGEFLSWRGTGDKSRALVLDVEQGARTLLRRLKEAGFIDENMKVPPRYAGRIDLVHEPDGLQLDSDRDARKRLENMFRNGHYDVVVADPLYKLHRGDANDEREAVSLMSMFDAWRSEYDFALILPMHCRKPQTGTKFSIHDVLGSSGYTRGGEIVVGLEMKNKGYSFLHWWKDREGDLGCINECWHLLYDRERGFSRDPKDLDEEHIQLKDLVLRALEGHEGLTVDELREETGETKPTKVERALDAIGATYIGPVRPKKDRRWYAPGRLFNDEAREVTA